MDPALAGFLGRAAWDIGKWLIEPGDPVEAVKKLRKAAEQGDANAQGSLGLCYATGEGVKQDSAEAVKVCLRPRTWEKLRHFECFSLYAKKKPNTPTTATKMKACSQIFMKSLHVFCQCDTHYQGKPGKP